MVESFGQPSHAQTDHQVAQNTPSLMELGYSLWSESKCDLWVYMYMYAGKDAMSLLSLPFQFHFPEEGAAVVVEGVQEVCWELEGGAEHDDHVGESHLVD